MRFACHAVTRQSVKHVSHTVSFKPMWCLTLIVMPVGQASLPDTCPVCAHTPLSSDLCKPNKALRTTLKAFLRTEEKKREKDRQSATPATAPASGDGTPAPSEQPVAEPVPDAAAATNAPGDQAAIEEKPEVAPSVEVPLEEQQAAESRPVEAGEEPLPDANPELAAEPHTQVISFPLIFICFFLVT